MLAKSWSQTEWAFPREQTAATSLRQSSYVDSDVEGFDQNCLRQGRREEHRDWGHHGSVAWRATEAEAFFKFLFMQWSMMLWKSIRFETTWQGRSARLLS